MSTDFGFLDSIRDEFFGGGHGAVHVNVGMLLVENGDLRFVIVVEGESFFFSGVFGFTIIAKGIFRVGEFGRLLVIGGGEFGIEKERVVVMPGGRGWEISESKLIVG